MISEGQETIGLKEVLDSLPFYVLLVDEDHRIVEANAAVQAQLQVSRAGVLGRYCPEVIHGLNEPWYACPLEEAVVTGETVEREAEDQATGRWFRSVVYPTPRKTVTGKRIFFHTVSDITESKKVEEELKASREQLRNLSAYAESAREEERTRIARAVHDELGQVLTALKLDVSWLNKRLDPQDSSVINKIRSVKDSLDSAIATVKRIAVELRPGILDDLGLVAAIDWLGRDFEKRTEIAFRFRCSPRAVEVDPNLSTALFRILQEALTNITRHARATMVSVELRATSKTLSMKVTDNGVGMDVERVLTREAFGLIGMQERARSFGGSVKFTSSEGNGATVLVQLPIAKAG